jgi:hypothetical protein
MCVVDIVLIMAGILFCTRIYVSNVDNLNILLLAPSLLSLFLEYW